MTEYSEKRDFQRMVIDCSLAYKIEGGQEHEGLVKDLSAKGIKFTTTDALTEGDSAEVILTPINSITPPMRAKITIIRCLEISENDYDIAAEILEII